MKNYIKLVAIAFTVFSYNSLNAQSNEISFFHLGDYVHQTTDISPVYIPKNSFSLGLVTNLGISIGNGFNAKDLLTKNEFSETLDYNFKNVYDQINGDYNDLQVSTTVNILNMTFKRKHGSLSLFANVKENLNWQMSKNGIIKLLTHGIPDNILINDKINVQIYAEAGIGFTQQFLKDKLAVGVRLKYLMGGADSSTSDDGFVQIEVNDDLNWIINTQNAITRTGGIPEEDGEFSTANSGFGLDIGATYEIIPNLVIEAAVNDLGSITWNENVKKYSLTDVTNLVIDGVELSGDDDEFENFTDKLIEDIGATEEKGGSYKTSLATTSYFSASYLLANKHQFRATMFQNYRNKDQSAVIGLGYNLNFKKTTFGFAGIKNSEDEMDLGLNFAFKLAFLQIYAATDNLNKLFGGIEEVKQANVRLGINFVFGYNKWL